MARQTLATLLMILTVVVTDHGQLRPDPARLALTSPELLKELKTDPFDYLRFINRPWVARVCEVFNGDLHDQPAVRLHGDAHIEQFAVSTDAWGLDDFDDSARGPALIDIVRFLGSVELVTRERRWTRGRDAVFVRFLAGYKRGLLQPDYRPPAPDLVRHLRAKSPGTRTAFLAWGESKMQPMEEASTRAVMAGMAALAPLLRKERPDLSPDYFQIVRAGWLRMGIGSAISKKILVRVQGPSVDPADDELIEAKPAGHLYGLSCLDSHASGTVLRVIAGNRQLGRMKHKILAVGPKLAIPEVVVRGEELGDWWIRSWDPSYREVHISDLRSVRDLDEIAFDAGVQLGAGSLSEESGERGSAIRRQAGDAIARIETRIRKETIEMVDELMRGWNELRKQ